MFDEVDEKQEHQILQQALWGKPTFIIQVN